jgi:glycosyltransferase involved in cell wall biosynthesis
MKIHIFLEIKDGPWGGGNQFLKALREGLRLEGAYAERFEDADVVLVNSHHFSTVDRLGALISFLDQRPDVRIVHRVDGPVTLIRNRDEGTDRLIFQFNRLFAQGSIFQSHWSLRHCEVLGMEIREPHTEIFNAPDPAIFHPPEQRPAREKLRLIATSWSPSPQKGSDVYQWMDRNLDWSRFEMRFVGNTAQAFQNIEHIPAVESSALARLLRDSDIFVTASRNDPCSNSLIEALHSGLPALARRDGGHPELVGRAGLLFETVEEIPALLEELAGNLASFRQQIALPSLAEVTQAYIDFAANVGAMGGSRRPGAGDAAAFVAAYRRYHHPSRLAKVMSAVRRRLMG